MASAATNRLLWCLHTEQSKSYIAANDVLCCSLINRNQSCFFMLSGQRCCCLSSLINRECFLATHDPLVSAHRPIEAVLSGNGGFEMSARWPIGVVLSGVFFCHVCTLINWDIMSTTLGVLSINLAMTYGGTRTRTIFRGV